MKVILTGDVFLGGDIEKTKPYIQVSEYHAADQRILNLEHPISNNKIEVNKSALFTNTTAIKSLKDLKATAVSLANNHIQDKGLPGITETILNLNDNGINNFGAGSNLIEARKPYQISENLYILSYCQYASPTLTQIQLATSKEAGVAPLDSTTIEADLEKLNNNSKAILYFHWGREHVWLTQYKNIELAKALLSHPKVALIVGMHPHRIQGYITKNSKRAYFSLGNFLFPNFHIKPPTTVYSPKQGELTEKLPVTRQYHSVEKITLKKWKLANRISLIIELDTETLKVKHIPVYQKDDTPEIIKITGLKKNILFLLINFLSYFYFLDKRTYTLIEAPYSYFYFKLWHLQIILHKVKYYGIKWLLNKISDKLNLPTKIRLTNER